MRITLLLKSREIIESEISRICKTLEYLESREAKEISAAYGDEYGNHLGIRIMDCESKIRRLKLLLDESPTKSTLGDLFPA